MQVLSRGRVARGSRNHAKMQHPQLLNFSEGRLLVRLLRIPRRQLSGGHGENGCGPENAGMVDDHDADAATARNAACRRMVGRDGRSLSHGLTRAWLTGC